MISALETSVRAQNLPTISIKNPITGDTNFRFYTNTTSISDRFNATAWVNEGTDVAAFQVDLRYNSSILNATRAWLPYADSEYIFFGMPTMPLQSFYVGEVKIGDFTLPFTGVTFTTPKKLAIIEFEILSAPTELRTLSSNLMIDNSDTFILDYYVLEIPSNKVNGLYEYVWLEPGLEVKPSKYTAVTKSETFNMSVWLNNVTISDQLVSVEFKLSYNTTLLGVTQVSEGSFLKQFGSTVFSHQEIGDYIKVNVTLTPSIGYPKGSGIITTVTFQSIYQDYEQHDSPFSFFDILFLDNLKNPVTPTTPPKNGSYTILPDRSSIVTIDVQPTSITIGSNATISGLVSSNVTKPNVNVTIYYRLSGSSWTNLTTTKTNSTGHYNYTWKPTTVGTFELKANWTGDATTDPAESEIATLTVKKLASAITISVNPSTVFVGESVTINGIINVTRSGVDVTIYRRLTGGTWNTLTTVQTDSSSQYNYVWATTEGGTYELYAKWLGDSTTLGAESQRATLTVTKIPSTITANANPSNTTVEVETKININGTVTANGVPRTNINVTIYLYYYSEDVNASIREAIAKVKTDGDGNYNYTWTATKKTLAENETFFFYADWLGDQTTSGNHSFNLPWLTVFKKNSTITINANSVTVSAKSNITLSGIITPTKTNTRVVIYYRPAGGTWSVLDTTQTNSSSIYELIWTPTKTTLNSSETFELKARWAGDVNTRAAESDVMSVSVEKAQSIITMGISSPTITIGSNATVSGVLTPNKANVNVTIYYKEEGATDFSNFFATTNSEGRYSYVWKPTKNATYELYVWWAGDENTYANQSSIAALKVNLIKSSITINVSPSIATVGSNITIRGNINPNKTNTDISIYHRLKDANQTWTLLGTTTTDSNGNYTYVWTTTNPGTFELEARWPGDDFTEPVNSQTASVKIEASFSPITLVPYILGGTAILILALAVIYLKKIKKH